MSLLTISQLRKIKWMFYRFRLHKVVEPFSGLLLNLAYLSKTSRWIHQHRNIAFNDFYSPKWDYAKRYSLYDYVMKEKIGSDPVHYMEFGVADGHSFRWWVKENPNSASRFSGFDTFEGLPEDWGGFRRGAMSANVPESDDPRVKFYKGLFQETVPGFVRTLDTSTRKVIMMDADLFTSTLYVLTSLAPYMKQGDIVLFDEFNVPMHEFLAFRQFVDSYYMNFELIGAANNFYFCAFELK